MHACFPVFEDRGLESRISPHFGSAPLFLVVDTATRAMRAVRNENAHHEHGRCHPIAALAGLPLDALVVGGIGAGALARLSDAGLRVYRSPRATVGEALAALGEGALAPVLPGDACTRGHAATADEPGTGAAPARPLRTPPRHGA